MDDMTMLENRMAEDAQRVAGPPRPVDARAVFDTMPTNPTPGRRIRSLFSATRLAVAGVVVALFGGFLLVSLSSEDPVADGPAAATSTPTDRAPEDPTEAADGRSFTSTEELVTILTTVEVEPGVLRVLDDGVDAVRGIERPTDSFPSMFVDVTPGGEVWLSGGGGEDDLFRLGEPGAFEDLGSGSLEVGPDGTLWAHDGDRVRSFHEGVWTSWQLEDGLETRALTIDRDGAPWVLAEEDTLGDERVLTLMEDGTWEHTDVPWDLSRGPGWRGLEATPDGSLWLSGGEVRDPDGQWTVAMVRFDGIDWEIVQAPGTTADNLGFAAGPKGELWRAFVDPEAQLDMDPEALGTDPTGDWMGLARLDGEGDWTTYGAADGVGSWGHRIGIFYWAELIEVGPQGTVWVNAARHFWDCGGVARFDGDEWTPYLEGRCVHDIAVAPDGGLWVRAYLDGWEGKVGTFVIPPGK